MSFGDFDGDGRTDVLMRDSVGYLDLSLTYPDGAHFFVWSTGFVAHVPTSWSIAGTGDFNGDGRDDIAWRRNDGAFTTWLAQPEPGWVNFVSNDSAALSQVPANWQVAGTGDFNGDGRDDLLWRRDDGAFTEWLGQAHGGFVSNDANAWNVIPTNWHVVGTGDYNGDGRDDVLWRRDDGALTNWLGQPNGGFVSNDAHAWNDVPNFWVIQPNTSGVGLWDY